MPVEVSRLSHLKPVADAPVPHLTIPAVLRPGPRFLLMLLTALPAAVVALAAVGPAERVSGLIAVTWYGLIPGALYSRWVALALPAAAAVFLILTVATLPFNSAAFVVDFWTTAAMLLLSLPRAP